MFKKSTINVAATTNTVLFFEYFNSNLNKLKITYSKFFFKIICNSIYFLPIYNAKENT